MTPASGDYVRRGERIICDALRSINELRSYFVSPREKKKPDLQCNFGVCFVFLSVPCTCLTFVFHAGSVFELPTH